MKILVTGSAGQLGTTFRRLAEGYPCHEWVFTDLAELDITDQDAIRCYVQESSVNCIINCAAYNDVAKAESDRERCELLNAKAPGYLAEAMKEASGLLVHISSDYVFGAEQYNTPCTEDREAKPSGIYGEAKLQGEQAVIATGCKHVIIRTAWLYSEYGKNFVKTMLNLTATKPSLKVVFDQVGTPTYALDLAKAIIAILENPIIGIYHYSNEGVSSWYDFAKAIAAYSNLNTCDIQPCHSSEFPSPVTRPSYSVLDKTKIKTTFGLEIPYWTDSLKACIHNLTKE